jgi:uncharacterized protein
VIGPFVNGASIVVGSVAGALLGKRVDENLRTQMPLVFGVASIGLGIAMVVKVKTLPPVFLALIVGTILGELVHLELGIQRLAARARGFVERFAAVPDGLTESQFLERFVAVLVLFAASGTGVFGALNEGMTGDCSLLIVKSFLDLFTAAIFATGLGMSVATLCIPQFVIQAALFLLATKLLPLTTPHLVADFSAVGGLIMLATGFRIAGIKSFAVANMLPALFIAMPITAMWIRLVR